LKIIVCGHARHGKDYVSAKLATALGASYRSTTDEMLREIAPRLGTTPEAILANKEHYRQALFDEIAEYTKDDPARLVRQVFERYDIYVGLRRREELLASRALADLIIWVYRPGYSPELGSCTITQHDCDIVLLNDENIDCKIARLSSLLKASAPR
jgi:hypothetical protein